MCTKKRVAHVTFGTYSSTTTNFALHEGPKMFLHIIHGDSQLREPLVFIVQLLNKQTQSDKI